ncbi:TolC family protein [Adhaeribacter radiodurans]|uniref:TolC family protein n=1 Tax=Adhaeribacter radiodurans TaxID=2745197 RepID=A0A7L7L5G3_9BACT|nr:TolC family protein [Adhaeribacter radiodurans]QMU28013.1 TolC family protein [Adhaeribacter radiodurans]
MKLTNWLNILVILLFTSITYVRAQTITLELIQQKAREHYPLTKQKNLIQESNALLQQNINRNYLPQLIFTGQASYQSEVTSINSPIPGLDIEAPTKDQYRILADVSQSLYDGGLRRTRLLVQQLNSETESQRLEVELYKLREQVNQLYFAIILLEEQTKQAALFQKDLTIGIKRTQAQVANGVTFKSNLNVLQAEHLKAGQRIVELQNTRSGFLQALSLLTGESLDQNTKLNKPVPIISSTPEIRRPELSLYNKQMQIWEAQKKLIDVALRPGISFFGQGGYGRPGLNLLKNEFDYFYLTGLRFTWRLNGWYTSRNEKKILDINKNTASLQQEVFLLNVNLQLTRERAEIQKLEELVRSDQEIIALRESVKKAAQAQLENAVITANDFLREVNAEDQARQALIIHQVQLLQSQLNYQTISGN